MHDGYHQEESGYNKEYGIEKSRVLFLCTGNSCRSQMAEALVNSRMGAEWEAYSAGSRPAGFVHPKALQALAEIGIQHRGRSKSMDEFRGQPFDLVVTVCDDSAVDCPVWLGKGKKVYMGFPDPADASGSEEEILNVFRSVRDDMSTKILKLLQDWPNRMAW
jgi:arsenate reductase